VREGSEVMTFSLKLLLHEITLSRRTRKMIQTESSSMGKLIPGSLVAKGMI